MEKTFDVNSRIKELCSKQQITFYQLSKNSNLPQSTLTNILNRGTVPSVFTLEKICNALGVSLSEFFSTTTEQYDLTTDQHEMLDLYIQLQKPDKERAIGYLQGLNKIVPEQK